MQTAFLTVAEDIQLFQEYFASRNVTTYPRYVAGAEKILKDYPHHNYCTYMTWPKSRIQFYVCPEEGYTRFDDSYSDALEVIYSSVRDSDEKTIQIARGRIFLSSWCWLEENYKQPQWLVDEYKAMRRWILKTAKAYRWRTSGLNEYVFPGAMKWLDGILSDGKNIKIM